MEQADRVRWADYVSLAWVLLTVLVGAWYVAIWFLPTAPINPFPPPPVAAQPDAVPPAVRAASVHGAVGRLAAFPPTWTPAPTALPTATATRVPTWTPRPASTPTPKPTLDPRWAYTIAGMRARPYPGSEVVLYGTFGVSPKYTTYLIFYNSEGLRISGMMNVPKGAGPFPVLILCHGYIHPDKYATGNDTWREGDYFANHGYITIAPDYRSHAASDNGVSFFHIGYAQDILNLISSLSSVQKADPGRVGIWGHSMGGAIALKAAVVSKKVDAVAVFGAVHADELVNLMYGMGNGPGEYGLARLGAPQTNRLIYRRISPINYLDRIPALSIHHGTGDQLVPYQWSEDLYEAAREDGIEAELYLYPDAGHLFRDADWDLALERTAAFFDKHVK